MDDALLERFIVALWHNAQPPDTVWSLLTPQPVEPDLAEIRRILASTRKFDYLSGRALKLDFSRGDANSARYDAFKYMLSYEEVKKSIL